jgi:hypothetical protein
VDVWYVAVQNRVQWLKEMPIMCIFADNTISFGLLGRLTGYLSIPPVVRLPMNENRRYEA